MGRTRPKCNEDCFHCIYEDCIADAAALTKDEKRAREAAHKKKYYEANREAMSIRMKAYYQAHKEQIKARARAYYWANKEKIAQRKKQLRKEAVIHEMKQKQEKENEQ